MRFLERYVTQASTWVGVAEIACSLGLLALILGFGGHSAEGMLTSIMGAIAAIGAFNVIRDEKPNP